MRVRNRQGSGLRARPLRRPRRQGSGRRGCRGPGPFVVAADRPPSSSDAHVSGTRQSPVNPRARFVPRPGGCLRSKRCPHLLRPRCEPPCGPRSRHSVPWRSAASCSTTSGPRSLPAGFVGVDVFFVVSGFLITGLLLRDAERYGRVRLREFYVRRARRILPAALVVLSACAVATLLFVPQVEWRPFLQQILSSSLYVRELAPRTRLADPEPRRPRVDAGAALLVAVGRGAVLPRLAAAHHPRALAGDARSGVAAWRVIAAVLARRDRGLVRARRDPDRAGPQPRVLLDALAGLGVRRRRPARHRARRRGGAAAAHARPRRVDRPRARSSSRHARSPTPSCSPARSSWCRCSAPRP